MERQQIMAWVLARALSRRPRANGRHSCRGARAFSAKGAIALAFGFATLKRRADFRA
jgi:hypothetical protein